MKNEPNKRVKTGNEHRDSANTKMQAAITYKDIVNACKRTTIGTKVCVIDYRKPREDGKRYGKIVKPKVIKRHLHLVTLDNGMSVTYAQLAIWYRKGKRGYIE